MSRLIRFWYLLPLLPFTYGWWAVLRVNQEFFRTNPNDAETFWMGLGLLAIACALIPLARWLRANIQKGWRIVGYALTTMAVPLWTLAFALSCFFAYLDGHSLHIGC